MFGRLYRGQHLHRTAKEAREAAAAQAERDRLADENVTLRGEPASLREQLEAAKTDEASSERGMPSAVDARQLAHHYVEAWPAARVAMNQIGT